MHTGPDPSQIFQLGMGFMGSKALLSAIELELFTVLATGGRTASQLGDRLQLHPRSATDFLDALVALGMLARDGDGTGAVYRNTPETDMFLDKNKPSYVGGIFEMANARLYPFWGNLTAGLQTGDPQNELAQDGGGGLFDALYSDEKRLEQFLHAMAGVQMGNFMMLAERFDFGRYGSFCDVGGALGALAVQVARRHEQVACTTFDLPAVAPFAKRFVEANGLDGRVEVATGDFFSDPLPRADVISMGNILHDWGADQKLALLGKAYDALPSGGAFVAIEMVIDNERRRNAMGLLMSLNMLIETPDGSDYTGADFDGWAREVGFASTEVMPLTGPTSAAIAWKS